MSDYPIIKDDYVTKTGLTDYQIWVLSCIQHLIKSSKLNFSDFTVNESYGKTTIKVLDKSLQSELSKASYQRQIDSYQQVA